MEETKFFDARFVDTIFEPNDVDLFEEFKYPKYRQLAQSFSGPYVILKKISDVNYEINKEKACINEKSEIVHVSRLRKYYLPENLKLSDE